MLESGAIAAVNVGELFRRSHPRYKHLIVDRLIPHHSQVNHRKALRSLQPDGRDLRCRACCHRIGARHHQHQLRHLASRRSLPPSTEPHLPLRRPPRRRYHPSIGPPRRRTSSDTGQDRSTLVREKPPVSIETTGMEAHSRALRVSGKGVGAHLCHLHRAGAVLRRAQGAEGKGSGSTSFRGITNGEFICLPDVDSTDELLADPLHQRRTYPPAKRLPHPPHVATARTRRPKASKCSGCSCGSMLAFSPDSKVSQLELTSSHFNSYTLLRCSVSEGGVEAQARLRRRMSWSRSVASLVLSLLVRCNTSAYSIPFDLARHEREPPHHRQ